MKIFGLEVIIDPRLKPTQWYIGRPRRAGGFTSPPTPPHVLHELAAFLGGGKIQHLKIDIKHYYDLLEGKKTFEIRREDGVRKYQVGDILVMNEIVLEDGRVMPIAEDQLLTFKVTHLLTHKDFKGIKRNYVIMSIKWVRV